VEAALLFNEKKYPPILPRVLRVVRAKAVHKTALASAASKAGSKRPRDGNGKPQIYHPKQSSEMSSLHGRAGKLLGRAGAAQLKNKGRSGANDTAIGKRGDADKGGSGIEGILKTPENIVFEGYRASAKSGKPKDLKIGGKGGGKKKGKSKTRSMKRASEWRKTGGKK
jgi:nucleolar protein 12